MSGRRVAEELSGGCALRWTDCWQFARDSQAVNSDRREKRLLPSSSKKNLFPFLTTRVFDSRWLIIGRTPIMEWSLSNLINFNLTYIKLSFILNITIFRACNGCEKKTSFSREDRFIRLQWLCDKTVKWLSGRDFENDYRSYSTILIPTSVPISWLRRIV